VFFLGFSFSCLSWSTLPAGFLALLCVDTASLLFFKFLLSFLLFSFCYLLHFFPTDLSVDLFLLLFPHWSSLPTAIPAVIFLPLFLLFCLQYIFLQFLFSTLYFLLPLLLVSLYCIPIHIFSCLSFNSHFAAFPALLFLLPFLKFSKFLLFSSYSLPTASSLLLHFLFFSSLAFLTIHIQYFLCRTSIPTVIPVVFFSSLSCLLSSFYYLPTAFLIFSLSCLPFLLFSCTSFPAISFLIAFSALLFLLPVLLLFSYCISCCSFLFLTFRHLLHFFPTDIPSVLFLLPFLPGLLFLLPSCSSLYKTDFPIISPWTYSFLYISFTAPLLHFSFYCISCSSLSTYFLSLIESSAILLFLLTFLLFSSCTDKKDKQIFLIYKEIQNGEWSSCKVIYD